MNEGRRISEDEARILWARAAELQAEALSRREIESSRSIDDGDGSTDGADAREIADTGYDLSHVREAALEAGISGEFLDRAFAEFEAGHGLERKNSDGFVDAFIGEGPLWLEAEEAIERQAGEVLAALRRVADHLHLTLIDSRGGDPLSGGVLVFERTGVDALMNHKVLQDLYSASVSELHVSLQVSEASCRLRIRAPLIKYRRVMAWTGVAINSASAGGVGLVAAVLAPGALVSLAGGLVGAALGLPAAALAFAAEQRLWRWMRAWGERSGQRGLEGVLRMIATDARTRGAFPLPEGLAPSGGLASSSGLDSLDRQLKDLL